MPAGRWQRWGHPGQVMKKVSRTATPARDSAILRQAGRGGATNSRTYCSHFAPEGGLREPEP